jgi:hypothetical protein
VCLEDGGLTLSLGLSICIENHTNESFS